MRVSRQATLVSLVIELCLQAPKSEFSACGEQAIPDEGAVRLGSLVIPVQPFNHDVQETGTAPSVCTSVTAM